jgi:hypothetical protein
MILDGFFFSLLIGHSVISAISIASAGGWQFRRAAHKSCCAAPLWLPFGGILPISAHAMSHFDFDYDDDFPPPLSAVKARIFN